jgi:thiosulfate dehydrogenase
MKQFKEHGLLFAIFAVVLLVILLKMATMEATHPPVQARPDEPQESWTAPSLYLDDSLSGRQRELVIYGEDLVVHTAKYFGPKGQINTNANGMNCQNCHLDAGKTAWGNNFSAVASTYPKFRERSGAIETIPSRVNDCFERSLNGEPIDTGSLEMKAFVAYINWVGKAVPKGRSPRGAGIDNLTYLDRAADPAKGAIVYQANCQSCHGQHGEGLSNPDGVGYAYPPLWGPNSFNTAAGLYRLSRLAGYAKDNMPFQQADHGHPKLTDAEAWDVAAFVNSQPRPQKVFTTDWPDISKKPVDHPFGPYADGFSEQQHKYGPYAPIIAARKASANTTH